MRLLRVFGFVVASVFTYAGCSGAATPTAPPVVPTASPAAPTSAAFVAASPAPTSAPTPVPSQGLGAAAVSTTKTSLGTFLVGPNGSSLYLFEADKTSKSTCSAMCAQTWPPLLTNGKPVAGTGVKQSLLSTTKRDDGSTQVTYNGHPLYYYAGDTNPGDTSGEGLNSFGAGWDVVSPAGAKIEGAGG